MHMGESLDTEEEPNSIVSMSLLRWELSRKLPAMLLFASYSIGKNLSIFAYQISSIYYIPEQNLVLFAPFQVLNLYYRA